MSSLVSDAQNHGVTDQLNLLLSCAEALETNKQQPTIAMAVVNYRYLSKIYIINASVGGSGESDQDSVTYQPVWVAIC